MAGFECWWYVTGKPSWYMSGVWKDCWRTVGGIEGAVLGAEAFVCVGLVRVELHIQDVAFGGHSKIGNFSAIPVKGKGQFY